MASGGRHRPARHPGSGAWLPREGAWPDPIPVHMAGGGQTKVRCTARTMHRTAPATPHFPCPLIESTQPLVLRPPRSIQQGPTPPRALGPAGPRAPGRERWPPPLQPRCARCSTTCCFASLGILSRGTKPCKQQQRCSPTPSAQTNLQASTTSAHRPHAPKPTRPRPPTLNRPPLAPTSRARPRPWKRRARWYTSGMLKAASVAAAPSAPRPPPATVRASVCEGWVEGSACAARGKQAAREQPRCGPR